MNRSIREKLWKVKIANMWELIAVKKLEVVRINSENSLECRQFNTTESGINKFTKIVNFEWYRRIGNRISEFKNRKINIRGVEKFHDSD